VIVVADSSPLVILAKLDCFELLNKLFSRIYISAEVYQEVAVAGAGLPGASEVEKAEWVEVKTIQNQIDLEAAQQKHVLGAGELSTILLAKELRASTVLLDDFKARKHAKAEGLHVRGTVGLLEGLYVGGHLPDLRAAFNQLLAENVYVDPRLLDRRLRLLRIPPL
jgi:uncharacterized protein